MKRNLSLILILILTISSILISGCTMNTNKPVDSSKLNIVTSIFPYYDFVREIAGDKANIKLLLSPGNEPHSYDPSPSDIVAIENCDIFIYNGGESDEWVESVLNSLDNKNIKRLCMMDYITPLLEQTLDHIEGEEYDEHIWTSLRNAQIMVKIIADELSADDSIHENYYTINSKKYINKLIDLDDDFSELSSNAKQKTLVFGDRFPFIYFINDYNLDYQCAFPGCSSETEPSISTVSNLIDYVRVNDIPVVFYVDFSNGKIAQIISEDSNAKPILYYSCHNVTKAQFDKGISYISLMENNLNSLREALS